MTNYYTVFFRDYKQGDIIEGNYKGKGHWYPGKVNRVRYDGSLDIDYDDGETEINVSTNLVRRTDVGNKKNMTNKNQETSSIEAGDKVEGNYKGKGRWYPGKIKRVRLDGSYDIDYDDGEVETAVASDMVRSQNLFEEPFSNFSIGDWVEVKGRWFSGIIRRITPGNLLCDIIFDDGFEQKNVPFIEIIPDESKSKATRNTSLSGKYHSGARVACFWYRPSTFGSARYCSNPKSAIILRLNPDDTYTVEIEETGEKLDDVLEKYLKSWTVGTNDLHTAERKNDINDLFSSLFKMSNHFVKIHKSSYNVPSQKDLQHSHFRGNMDKIRFILGEKVYEEFVRVFKYHDKHDDNEIDLNAVRKGYEDLGGYVSVEEIKEWIKLNKKYKGSVLSMNSEDFFLAFANLFYPTNHDELDEQDYVKSLGRSLRLSSQTQDLAKFAHRFGKKQLREIEKAFDLYSAADIHGVSKLTCRDLIECFLSMGRAITVTRLLEWMTETDVQPLDKLTLADFVSVYAYFFTPKSEAKENLRDAGILMTLSELTVQILQEEKWIGSQSQVVSYIRRLCSGRSNSLVECISKIREAFEIQDHGDSGDASVSTIHELFKIANINFDHLDEMVQKFLKRLEQQMRGRYSLPEVFEFFGANIQEFADASLTVMEAIAIFRMNASSAEIRLAAEMANKILNNIIEHSNDRKYWQVNMQSEEFNAKIWRHSSGQLLMKSFGFGTPFNMVGKDGRPRLLLGLKQLPKDISKMNKLPIDVLNHVKSVLYQLDEEIIAMEGSPSITAAIREIRNHCSDQSEVKVGVETALTIVTNVLAQPKDIRMHRIKKGNPIFRRNLGRLEGSELLMNAIGFIQFGSSVEDDHRNSGAYVLKSIETGAIDGEEKNGNS